MKHILNGKEYNWLSLLREVERISKKEFKSSIRGERLELALYSRGMSKAELARRMGKSRQHVNNWCKNGAYSIDTLEAILNEIHMPVDEFCKLKAGK